MPWGSNMLRNPPERWKRRRIWKRTALTKPTPGPEQETVQPPSRKRFKEMTVHEKIDYLIHKPGFLPEIPVMIQTNSIAYRAVILERMEDQLSVMPFSSMETAWINLDEITDIKLLVQ
jgi:hypothetical protein